MVFRSSVIVGATAFFYAGAFVQMGGVVVVRGANPKSTVSTSTSAKQSANSATAVDVPPADSRNLNANAVCYGREGEEVLAVSGCGPVGMVPKCYTDVDCPVTAGPGCNAGGYGPICRFCGTGGTNEPASCNCEQAKSADIWRPDWAGREHEPSSKFCDEWWKNATWGAGQNCMYCHKKGLMSMYGNSGFGVNQCGKTCDVECAHQYPWRLCDP